EVSSNGVFILNVLEEGAAAGLLSPGDRLMEIDGQAYDSMEEFLDYLSTKEVGDEVELVIERDERTINQAVTLAPLPTEPERAGIGISFVEDKEIETTPEVSIDSDTIGGPSAGLMFTLEILNQLLDEDITKGYDIAGTGTMESDGTVGRIGGIDQKVIAADRAGIDIFFAPDDEADSELPSNFDQALETAEEIDTEMDIVPVTDIDAALDYLSELSPR